GATVRRVEFGAEDARESALIEALTPATRVMAVSHVHWVTGTRLDLARLAAACHAVGALLVVDGIQAMGAIPIELGETDVYCGAVFKWLLSGFGLAVLVMRDRAREVLSPRVRGYNNDPPSLEIQHSHVNYPGLYALSSCLNYLETVIGWDAVHARVRALTAELEFGLADLGLRVITPLDARAGIVSCEVPDAVAIRDRLADEGIFVEARGGLLRVSPHFYNTSADLTAFLGAVSRNGPLSAR
ncbi:MAG: aminotransferase class V-fold PLP-dependent enzyme, partial [Gemmatimonadetes bacterium]|nr:aminotransferase class V-fold PLP-dependent enzyme [Gemmatimonadota bacterium]